MPTKNDIVSDPVLNELESIKRLLTLLLFKIGTPQSEIAIALGIDQSNVSRMFPSSKIKPLKP